MKELKINPDIIIRKANKSNNFVIFDKEDYRSKLDAILSDSEKIIRVTKDPTKILKQRINKLIDNINATSNSKGFRKPEWGLWTWLHLWYS